MPVIINTSNNIHEEEGDIKLLSTEVKDIISQKPNWMVRNGMMLFFLIICAFFGATFFIYYPDVIKANAKFTSVNAPKEVVAKTDGRLVIISVHEGKKLKQNEIIGYMEARASHEEVLALSLLTDTLQSLLENEKQVEIANYSNISFKNLGELQQVFQIFIQSLKTFQQYLSRGFYLQKLNMLRNDLECIDKLIGNLNKQKVLQQEDLILAKKTLDANKSLSDDKIISPFDYRNERSKYIGKAIGFLQINAAITNNESGRNDKEKEIAQLQNEISQQKEIFLQALNTMKSHIEDWKNKYLLIAPVSGKVEFVNPIQENTVLKVGQTVCFINPEHSSYYATVIIPQANFGKVRTGQTVLLKLPAYTYQEFGFIIGKVDYIADIPSSSGFFARIILPNGMQTNYKKHLQYREGLTAQAEIITENAKLSDKLCSSLKSVIIRN